MGLVRLAQDEWLQPSPNLAARVAAFDAFPESVQLMPESAAPAAELADMLSVPGGLEGTARSAWEDMCLLVRRPGDDVYRLVGAAVAFPTDWRPADKLGLPLVALHRPIHGYAEQLASGVDHFMAKLAPGPIFGRSNWFVSPVPDLRWLEDRPDGEAFAGLTDGNAGERLFVRCERQTLRRLPETGAILFTIGVYLAPLGTLSDANVGRLAEALATIPPEEAARRGAPHFAPQVQAFAARRSAA